MTSSKKLVFFGTEDFSAAGLSKLIASGYKIVAIVTKPDAKSGRGQKLRSPAIVQAAKIAGIRLLQPAKPADIKDELMKLKPDCAVLVAYGKILPQEILDLFPDGIINVHPSLLPKYRGPSPVETAILNDDKVIGVSLIKLTSGMDEGPVYIQEKMPMPPRLTGTMLEAYLAEVGATMLQQYLPDILSGKLKSQPQNDTQATYTKLLKKSDGLIEFNEPAETIERKVRAYFGFPKAHAKIFGHDVIILEARVAKDADDGQLVRVCEPGYLEIQKLVAPSGRIMSGADFLRGYAKK